MKKFFVLFLFISLTLSSYAFEIPKDKVVNKAFVEKSIISYTEKIKVNPNSEDAFINRAFLYFLMNNIDLAILDYDKLILINPNNEEYFLNRGYLKHISNRQEEALIDYDSALKIKPDYAFAYNNRGVALAELGKIQESLSSYNKALEINPDYSDVYYNRGNLKVKTEKNEEALEDYNTAIKLNPKDSASFNNRGVAKRKLNYNVGALSDFSIAIKLNPDDITAFANRGRLKKRYYDSEGAEEDIKNAIAIAEDSPIIVKQIEMKNDIVYRERQAEIQKPQLRESKVASDNIQKIAYNQVFNSNKSENSAVKTGIVKVEPRSYKVETLQNPQTSNVSPKIETKPVTNPELAECYYIRALQKYILQNRESALNDFNLAIQHNPNYAEAYYYRAAIKRDFKDEGFVDDYRKAVQLNPALKSVEDADVLMILKI